MKQNHQLIVLAIIISVTVAIFSGFYQVFIKDDIVDKIRRGDRTLICIMQDQERIIEGKKVTDFMDGTFYFINGQASNCRVLK